MMANPQHHHNSNMKHNKPQHTQTTAPSRRRKVRKPQAYNDTTKVEEVRQNLAEMSLPSSTLSDRQTYGTTQALILDGRRKPDGTVTTYSASRTFADAFANRVHPEWLVEKERRIAKNTPLLEEDDYESGRPASCMKWRKAFAKYLPYPKLLGERIHAKNYPFKEIRGSWSDLLGEVRNMIYRFTLTFDEPIEHAPQLGHEVRHNVYNVSNGLIPRSTLKPVLNILRVNKQIKREASSIYYGENTFQFSKQDLTCGSELRKLQTFLDRIGRINTAHLRSVVIGLAVNNTRQRHQPPESNKYNVKLVHVRKQDPKPVQSVDSSIQYHTWESGEEYFDTWDDTIQRRPVAVHRKIPFQLVTGVEANVSWQDPHGGYVSHYDIAQLMVSALGWDFDTTVMGYACPVDTGGDPLYPY